MISGRLPVTLDVEIQNLQNLQVGGVLYRAIACQKGRAELIHQATSGVWLEDHRSNQTRERQFR
jgi:hypothetical protein